MLSAALLVAACDLSRSGYADLPSDARAADANAARDARSAIGDTSTPDPDGAPGLDARVSDAGSIDATMRDMAAALDAATPDAFIADLGSIDFGLREDASVRVCPPPAPPVGATPLVRYTFEPGLVGGVVPDESEHGCFPLTPVGDRDALELDSGDVTFTGGQLELGLEQSQALARLLRGSPFGFSVEVWVRVSTRDQSGPARIATLSTDTGQRSFTIAHGSRSTAADLGDDVIGRFRTTATNPNGMSSGELVVDDDVLDDSSAHHIVLVWAPPLTLLYVDGAESDRFDHGAGVSLDWATTDRFVLGNELTQDRPWSGSILALSIFTVPLGPAEVDARRRAGAE